MQAKQEAFLAGTHCCINKIPQKKRERERERCPCGKSFEVIEGVFEFVCERIENDSRKIYTINGI